MIGSAADKLFGAAERGDVSALQSLLATGIDIDTKDVRQLIESSSLLIAQAARMSLLSEIDADDEQP